MNTDPIEAPSDPQETGARRFLGMAYASPLTYLVFDRAQEIVRNSMSECGYSGVGATLVSYMRDEIDAREAMNRLANIEKFCKRTRQK